MSDILCAAHYVSVQKVLLPYVVSLNTGAPASLSSRAPGVVLALVSHATL